MGRLPPGFRFHPTDVELVMYYLKRKIMGKKLHFDAITELNIYKVSPWDLPGKCCYKSKDLEWYFFCPRERKYASGARMNRATETGYWKTTGKDRSVIYDEKVVGSVKTLIFHRGHPPKGQRTDWVIHEYRFEDKGLADAGFVQDAYVLCRVFQKNGLGPKNGAQYGAPFKEDDWEDDEVPAAEPFTLDVFSAPPGLPENQSYSIVSSLVDPGSTSGWHSGEPSQPSIQRIPSDERDPGELPAEPNPSNVSSMNWMPSDKLDDEEVPGESNPSNILSALLVLPDKESYSIGSSMINPGPGPSNALLCTNEMHLDEQDDEIIGLLAHFTDDPSLLSAGNENSQNMENFNQDLNALTPFTGGNDIFDGLGDIDNWAGLGQSRSNISASWGANYSFNHMIVPDDVAFMELNDLETPLYHSAETIETGQFGLGNFYAPYNSNVDMQQLSFASNHVLENQLPMLPVSYTQQVNHSGMVRPCSLQVRGGSSLGQ
uniref:Nam-like protein 2 n=1 Tax=Petunia hybrida TaxID=4102 RepID=Q8LRM3_PETHY|nr:nam-like protein 2 [Petunia x hybrida]